MTYHDKIIELLDEITAEQDPKKLQSLVKQLNQLLVDEVATLTAQLESRMAS